MPLCKTCDDKGYTGLKREECWPGCPPTDKPCPDCAARKAAAAKAAGDSLKIGTHSKASVLRNYLRGKGHRLNVYADDLMLRDFLFSVSSVEKTVKLREVPLPNLHLGGINPTVEQIVTRGVGLNYAVCPVEVAPQYHIQYQVMQVNTVVVFGIQPILYCGRRWCFIITHNHEGQVLRAVHGDARLTGQIAPFNLHQSQVKTIWLG